MPLRELDETTVVSIAHAVGIPVDDSRVRTALAQASTAVSLSKGDPARLYAAAVIFQIILKRPFRSRNSTLAWICAVESLRLNGFDVDKSFDPSPQLQGLVAAHGNGTMVLQTCVGLIDAAIIVASP